MSEQGSTVVRLLERANGFSPDDPADLCDWAQAWIENIKDGDYGKPRSLVIVVERDDGRIGVISQSLGPLDRARLCGLMHIAAQWKASGDARIEDLKP
jgi:hypothetical protein